MRYLALACDYDGTIARDGQVADSTLSALERVASSGRKLMLVTGRELDDLLAVFPGIGVFDRVVAENGALLYRPHNKQEQPLADPPPAPFIEELRRRGITPLSAGRVIVATREPHQSSVLDAIRSLGLELQVIFNKGAVMVLPAGVNKASGLMAALLELGLSPHNVAGVGDAENDHAFLSLCECSAAVANALPMVRERADYVAGASHGGGVEEFISRLLDDDLESLDSRLSRHHVLLGTTEAGDEVKLSPYGTNVMLAGTEGSGKSTLATALLERLAERGYQLCIVDPEGDYENFPHAVALGSNQRPPTVEEVTALLGSPAANASVNLIGLPLDERPAFFGSLLPRLVELRAATGRPHWILVDETHHLLHSGWDPATVTVPRGVETMLFIAVHPDQVAPAVLDTVDMVVALGDAPEKTLREFCLPLNVTPPAVAAGTSLRRGEALVWRRNGEQPFRLKIPLPVTEHQRHRRKYVEGELPEEDWFYFRGPEGKLKLRAANLVMFLQMAAGVDEGTWNYHLSRRDYSTWFRTCIKDDDLAREAKAIEAAGGPADESRGAIRAAIERRYTLPAGPAVSAS